MDEVEQNNRDLSVASKSIICRSRKLWQIIDLRDTDKSRYFRAITESNNCFIIRSPSLVCFLMNILGKRSDLPFSRRSDRKKEKSTVSLTHAQNIICSPTLKPNNTAAKRNAHGQSAKTADWLEHNDVKWLVLHNCACAKKRSSE